MEEETKSISLSRDDQEHLDDINEEVGATLDTSSVIVEDVEDKLEDIKPTTTKTVVSPSKKKEKRNLIFLVLFVILDLFLLGVILWQIISIFMSIGS